MTVLEVSYRGYSPELDNHIFLGAEKNKAAVIKMCYYLNRSSAVLKVKNKLDVNNLRKFLNKLKKYNLDIVITNGK